MSNDTGFRSLAPRSPLYAKIDSSEASIDVVAAVDGHIDVISLVLSCDGAGDIVFNSGVTELGTIAFKATDPPLRLTRNSDSWLRTAEAEKLNITNSTNQTLKGFLTYVIV